TRSPRPITEKFDMYKVPLNQVHNPNMPTVPMTGGQYGTYQHYNNQIVYGQTMNPSPYNNWIPANVQQLPPEISNTKTSTRSPDGRDKKHPRPITDKFDLYRVPHNQIHTPVTPTTPTFTTA